MKAKKLVWRNIGGILLAEFMLGYQFAIEYDIMKKQYYWSFTDAVNVAFSRDGMCTTIEDSKAKCQKIADGLIRQWAMKEEKNV